MELAKIEYVDYGLACEHNMPCAVYSTTEHAVCHMNTGVFQPSWMAQGEGWHLIQAKTPFQRFLLRFFL